MSSAESKHLYTQPVLGNYIDGQWARPEEPNGEWVSRSPADPRDRLGTFTYGYRSVDAAAGAARGALKLWARTPLTERAELLKRYQAELRSREGLLAQVIAREVGKPLWEAKTEVSAMLGKVDITLGESLRLVESAQIADVLPGALGRTRYKPLGVMAVIGPFNFPGHLANGHIVPALATGNTVVFKPSEKSPMVGQMMAECFQAAGFPPGVFNLLQGEREVGRRLCLHEEVSGVLFTGSYEVGVRIKQDTLQQHWKLLALEMGGKNPAIIAADADLDSALFETLFGAFVTAGQRCSATSRVIVHRSRLPEYVARLHAQAKALKIGPPLEDPFMGPLIDSSAVDRYLKFLGIATREGAEMIMRGKALETDAGGYFVTPSICVSERMSVEQARKSVYQQTEFFAPNVSVIGFDEWEEAIELANATQYGLVASVFTRDRALYEQAWEGLEFGLVNWNKSTVGASSRLPFGGLKKSGNHFPTASEATRYCTSPIASLEVDSPKLSAQATQTPGLNWVGAPSL